MKNKSFILSLLSVLFSLLLCFYASTMLQQAQSKEEQLGEAYNMLNESLTQIEEARTEVNTMMYNMDIIYTLSQEYNLDLKIVTAVMRVESQFNPYAVSPSGRSYGLMQINEAHLKQFEDKMDILDIERNVQMGSMILSNLSKENNDIEFVLNSYNMGKYGYIDYVNETGKTSRAYSRKVISIIEELKGV